MPKTRSSCIIMLDSAIESDLAIPPELTSSFSCKDEICDTSQCDGVKAEEKSVPPCIVADGEATLLDLPETVWIKPETLCDMKIDVLESLESLREGRNKDKNEEEERGKAGEEPSSTTAEGLLGKAGSQQESPPNDPEEVCSTPLLPTSDPSKQPPTLPSTSTIPTMHITDSMIASAFPQANPTPPLRPAAGLPAMQTIFVRQDMCAPASSGPTNSASPSPSTPASTPMTPTYSSPSTSTSTPMTPTYPMINCEGLLSNDSGTRSLTGVDTPCLQPPQCAQLNLFDSLERSGWNQCPVCDQTGSGPGRMKIHLFSHRTFVAALSRSVRDKHTYHCTEEQNPRPGCRTTWDSKHDFLVHKYIYCEKRADIRFREFLCSVNKDDILKDPGVLLIADPPPPVSPQGAVSPPRADSPAAVSPPRTVSPPQAPPPWLPEIALIVETARPSPVVAPTSGITESGTLDLLCTLCGWTFHPSNHLEHLLIMHKVNPRTLPSTVCAECKITLPLVELATHYAAKHMLAFSKTDHPHPLAFATPVSLRKPDSGYSCTSCPSSFTTSRGLASHVRVHEGPYMCDCQKLFLTQGQMKTHRAKHRGKFNCTGCGLRFVYKLTLEKHKAKRCAPTCNICKDVFPKLSTLAIHARKSHPPFRHCHKCGLGFGSLETHNC